MNKTKYLDDEIIITKAINILFEELGPVETIRCLTLPKSKRIESVKRHREWQKTLNKDIFFDEVFTENSC